MCGVTEGGVGGVQREAGGVDGGKERRMRSGKKMVEIGDEVSGAQKSGVGVIVVIYLSKM